MSIICYFQINTELELHDFLTDQYEGDLPTFQVADDDQKEILNHLIATVFNKGWRAHIDYLKMPPTSGSVPIPNITHTVIVKGTK